MKEISVTIKNVYGTDRVYPACKKAVLFAQLTGNKTFSEYDIKRIKELGYNVELKNHYSLMSVGGN